MAVDMARIHKGMQVHSSDGAKLGKVADVWIGVDPTHSNERCDEELCSRLEVHHGLLRKEVLYIPYNAIAEVSDEAVRLKVDEATAHSRNWSLRPKWIGQGVA